jgi:hypothetical protein
MRGLAARALGTARQQGENGGCCKSVVLDLEGVEALGSAIYTQVVMLERKLAGLRVPLMLRGRAALLQALFDAAPDPMSQKRLPTEQDVRWDEWMRRMAVGNSSRGAFPPDDILQYAGQTVAWEPDRSGIRAAGADSSEVWKQIREEGDDPSWYTYDCVEKL